MAITNEGFSNQWEKAYSSGRHLSLFPWTDLVILVNKFAHPSVFEKSHPKVLEIGCGAGANISFLKNIGFEYHGIDGSDTAINLCRDRFPDIKNNLIKGDFSESFKFEKKFDLIVDRASLTHNTTITIKNILSLIENSLTEDGKYVGVTLFSTEHPQFLKGIPIKDDKYTKTKYLQGPFNEIGNVHFFNLDHIESLFLNFSIEHLEHIEKKTIIGNIEDTTAFWNIVVSKFLHEENK